nr:hypothetical protein [Dysosmobacter welbionis]
MHLAKLVALNKIPVLGINMGAWASSRSWRPGSWRPCGS